MAAINWGDGHTSVATVSGSAGSFVVNGKHRYARNGHFTVVVTVRMGGPASALADGSGIVVVSNPGKLHQVARLIHRLTRKRPKGPNWRPPVRGSPGIATRALESGAFQMGTHRAESRP